MLQEQGFMKEGTQQLTSISNQEKLGTFPVKTLARPLRALSQKLSVYGKRMYTCFRVRRGSLVKIS